MSGPRASRSHGDPKTNAQSHPTAHRFQATPSGSHSTSPLELFLSSVYGSQTTLGLARVPLSTLPDSPGIVTSSNGGGARVAPPLLKTKISSPSAPPWPRLLPGHVWRSFRIRVYRGRWDRRGGAGRAGR